MEARAQLISILGSAILLLIVFELVRQRRLMERYALLWLGCTVVVLAMAVWKDLLERFASAIGVYYAPSALFAVALAAILMLLLHFSLVLSRLADQNKVLAQKLALLQQRVDELEDDDAVPAAAQADDGARGRQVPAAR